MYDLIVEDEVYGALQEFYVKEYQNIHSVIREYIKIMENVAENGIMEGDTAEALAEFNRQLKMELDSEISVSKKGKVAKRYCMNFVKKIDKRDKKLY